MNIFILSRNKNLYSTSRLVEAGNNLGHNVRVVDYMRCYMNIASRRPTIYYGGESLGKVDSVIPRIGASNTFYGTAVVKQFEMMNSYCVNTSDAIANSRDKLRSLQILGERIGFVQWRPNLAADASKQEAKKPPWSSAWPSEARPCQAKRGAARSAPQSAARSAGRRRRRRRPPPKAAPPKAARPAGDTQTKARGD